MSIDSLIPPAPTLPPRSNLAALSWALLIVWLGSSVASFWLMEMRDWRSFGPGEVAFADIDTARVEAWYRSMRASLRPAGKWPALTVVHLYNADCRCNRFVEPHLKRLIEGYQTRGVQFLAAPAQPIAAHLPTPANLPVVAATRSTLAAAGVNSSPAALIFDAAGRLIYYGPYSDSAWCGSTGNLVEPVLERALSGLTSARRPRPSRGCFCGW